MGRPLHTDVEGTRVTGKFTGGAGIKVEFHDGNSLRTDGIIVKQRGAKAFVVAREGTPLTRFTCVLQSAEPSAFGQMRINGFTDGSDGSAVAIAKITKRVVTDFSTNKYTWRLINFEDSTGDVIRLVPVTA